MVFIFILFLLFVVVSLHSSFLYFLFSYQCFYFHFLFYSVFSVVLESRFLIIPDFRLSVSFHLLILFVHRIFAFFTKNFLPISLILDCIIRAFSSYFYPRFSYIDPLVFVFAKTFHSLFLFQFLYYFFYSIFYYFFYYHVCHILSNFVVYFLFIFPSWISLLSFHLLWFHFYAIFL